MPQGISIGVGSDTRDFAKGVKSGIVQPLEDAQDTFGDVARAGDKATQQLQDGFRDQQKATVDFGRDYEQMSQQIRSSSQKTSRSISNDAADFSHRTEQGLDEIKESAKSNAIEVGASFTGGFDQAAGGLQGFLAEFLAGFGPAGIVAGIAAATGIGLITPQIDDGTAAAETQKQAVSELAGEYIDAGKAGKRAFGSVADQIKKMATSTDGSDVIITLQDAFKRAEDAGADYKAVVEAIASESPRDIQSVLDKVKALEKAHLDDFKAASTSATSFDQNAFSNAASASVLIKALEKAKTAATEAGRAQELAAEAGISKLQLQQDEIAQIEKAYDDAAGSADKFIDKQGKFDAAGFIKEVQRVRHELEKYKDDLAKTDLSAEAKKFLESQGAQTAASMLEGYKSATPKQQAQLAEIWSTAGDDNATTYEAALGKNLAKIKPKVAIPKPVIPAPDSTQLDAYLRDVQRKRITIPVDLVARNGKRIG